MKMDNRVICNGIGYEGVCPINTTFQEPLALNVHLVQHIRIFFGASFSFGKRLMDRHWDCYF